MQVTKTLSQYLLDELAAHPQQAEIISIISELANIGKIISKETNRAGIADILGAAGETNVHGEDVQKLDVFANELCKKYLSATGHFCALASEEEDGVVDPGDAGAGGQFVIAFDPLDGSSNIDVNVSIGTIFSVHARRDDVPGNSEEQFYQKGSDQVLAGYILYGSSTVFVYSTGDGVHEFTLDQHVGDFFLSQERIMIPEKGKYYSLNEGKLQFASQKEQQFIAWLQKEQQLGSRYIGSFVADVHRTLLKGGVFLYPALDSKGTGEFKPKLRLNYEVKPLCFLQSAVGGASTNGDVDILDIVPTSLHERQPVIMGNQKLIDYYLSL